MCGARVSMVAKVGSDLFGPATIRNFESQGIDASHVGIVEGVSSGVAPIFVEESGQNRILVVKGANDELKADVDRAAPLLTTADCIVMQFEVPLPTVYHTIRWAKAKGIRSILNPAPGQPVDLKEVSAVNYFIPNESEAEAIAGMPVRNVEEAKRCATSLLHQGLRRVIITLGEKGALLAGPEILEVIPAYPVRTVDTTGAGDAFVGSFAVFLAEGAPEREALARANLYAALSTTKVGTQKSFLERTAFEEAWGKM